MLPDEKRASTGYCLAEPGVSYVVFAPDGGDIEVDLTDARAMCNVEWLEVATGKMTRAEPVTGGTKKSFRADFNGPAVLFLHP